MFTGLYVEDNAQLPDGPQAGNTLDPSAGALLCPFARSGMPMGAWTRRSGSGTGAESGR